MAKIVRTLSTKTNSDGTSEIYLRVTVSRTKQLRIRSGIFVPASSFRRGAIIMPRVNQQLINRLQRLNAQLTEIENEIVGYCLSYGEAVTKQALTDIVDRYHHPDRHDDAPQTADFFAVWDEFIGSREMSENRKSSYRSLCRALHRYEIHRRITRDVDFKLTIENLTADDIIKFEQFYRNEWQYYDEYPQMYLDYPAEARLQHKTHRPQRRGDNICVCTLKKIRAFFNWCNAQGLTDNRPFLRYDGIKTERYGTPYYLTIEERDHIADFDLSERPQLAVQRDIFIFQCLVGCRVSDLRRLMQTNVMGDWLEYVPQKTKKERAETVRVPLCQRAKDIITRHRNESGERLLPFISDQRYNRAIKEICKLCGIDRQVTVINSVTGKDERRAICDIASSHMARRTFIGNIYKQVKDPNLVSALSGHKEGSRAFSRYRNIDDDIKRGLIDLIQ